jgi:hypothetical protein
MKTVKKTLAFIMAVIWGLDSRAESVNVKYRGPVDLNHFCALKRSAVL